MASKSGCPPLVGLILGVGCLASVGLSADMAGTRPGTVDSGTAPVPIAVHLRTERPIVQAGREVWVEFAVVNRTGDPVTLRVPDAAVRDEPIMAVGLPVYHVFSGQGFTGLVIRNKHGDTFNTQVRVQPRGPVPVIQLAPFGTIGLRLELTQYYDSLRRPGQYQLTWKPYQGMVESSPLPLQVLPERQAIVLTEFGKMTMRFRYDEAPNHVANFIELIESKFYDNLTFNRVIPGGLIQGGDPRGDRRGVRPDGKRLAAEFSRLPFEPGTVGMARSPHDPDSASCQFFICVSRQPSFDGMQTAFGYLVGEESFETLRKIAAVPTGPDDQPRKPVYIRAITLENVPAREPDHEVLRRTTGTEDGATSRPVADAASEGPAAGPNPGTRPAPRLDLVATRRPTPASRPASQAGNKSLSR